MERASIPAGLLQALQLTMDDSPKDVSPRTDEPSQPRPPILRKLVEEMRFSHRLILTYYAALGLIVLLFSIRRWWTKHTRSIRPQKTGRLNRESGTPTSNASSDSTLIPSDDNSVKDMDTEQTPLLSKNAVEEKIKHHQLPTLVRHARSILMRQPKPIPALTAPSNVLPQNGATAVVIILISINIFYLFYHVPISVPMLFVFADRAGLCFVANLPVLYLLAAKTNQPLQFLTGWSYEGLNLFHRRIGEWMMVLAVCHGVGMFGVWYTLLRPEHFDLMWYLSNRVVILGICSLTAYLTIWITSIGWFRRLYYETFLGLHVVIQVAALTFLFFHHPKDRPYVVASLIIWAADRILSRMFLSKRKLVATLQVAPDEKTVLVFCNVPISATRLASRFDVCNGWLAGQHIFISIPGLGWWHKLQAHPFTIASPAPPASAGDTQWPLQLTIRAQDGFSKSLLQHAKFHQHTEIWIDGPYGSSEALDAVQSADRVCFVAGGSGIAVTYPLCWAFLVAGQQSSVVSARSVYDNGRRNDPDLHHDQVEDTERYAHLWIRQDPRSDSWIGYFPRQASVLGQSPTVSDDVNSVRQDVVDLVTDKFETAGFHTRRPDLQTELRSWVQRGGRVQSRMVIIASGPDSLVRDVCNAAATLVLEGHDIDVHVEKFGW